MDKKVFIYVIYILMGILDFSVSRKLGVEMVLFTIILISIKLYSVYVNSIATLVITSILSIFLLYNNTSINYEYVLVRNNHNIEKQEILKNTIKSIDHQIANYWISGDNLIKLQADKQRAFDELSVLSGTEGNSNTTSPYILILVMASIYLSLILLTFRLFKEDKPTRKIVSMKNNLNIEKAEESKRDSTQDKLALIMETKRLGLQDFTNKYGYKKSQYYNLRNYAQ